MKVRERRRRKLNVSSRYCQVMMRRLITEHLYDPTSDTWNRDDAEKFKASKQWLHKFMRCQRFVKRKRTNKMCLNYLLTVVARSRTNLSAQAFGVLCH
mmetsp:Transcript_9240/g.19689  ORF Transcript_9240/g.19689 Transcript_9240/m.19689 type:complete len:98 (-) Transcript_9240:92-385(-)